MRDNLFSITTLWECPGGPVVRTLLSEGPGGKLQPTKKPASHHSKHLIWVNSLNSHKNPVTSILFIILLYDEETRAREAIQFAESQYFKLREIQVADKLISHTWIQVPLSPSYSLCDLRNGFISQNLFYHLSIGNNVI